MKNFLKALVLCSSAILPLQSLSAYELRPMVIELSPSGSGSSATVTIVNTHEVAIAIEVLAYERTQKPDGSDDLKPELEDVIISPPQMIIQPGQSQSVRVQWVGEPNPATELPFRLVTQQVPIRIKQETRNDRTADLTMKYRYEAALYVIPKGVKPSAHVSSAEVIDSEQGRKLRLSLVSDGTKRAILDAPTLDIQGPNGSIKLEGESIASLQGLNILPGSTRVVEVPAPAGLLPGTVEARMDSRYLFSR